MAGNKNQYPLFENFNIPQPIATAMVIANPITMEFFLPILSRYFPTKGDKIIVVSYYEQRITPLSIEFKSVYFVSANKGI
jgi:hypothetical protein